MGNETKNISYNNLDDSMRAPQKQENKNKRKKKSNLPVWAKRALCIVLLVAVLAGIVAIALITNGTAMRNNIIVESKTGQFDINQQMATFILWQAMYQQGYNEWINEYYTSLYTGSSSSSSSIDFKTYASPDVYAVTVAAYYTKEALNSGLYSIKDYLIELVAGADAAIEAGLKYEAHDKEDVESVVTWVKNIYIDLGFAIDPNQTAPFNNFLTEYVGDGFKVSDIKDAAKVMIMYSKYSDYKSFELQSAPSADNLQDYILKNPTGYFSTEYFSFTGADEAMIRNFFTENFINDRFESTLAKHYANIDRLAITNLKEAALEAKLEELALNNAQKYTKTTTDGKATYSPELDEAIGEYIFSTANKQNTFAAISGDKCAYLIYFKENSTATEATIAFKKYSYEDAKVALEEAMAGNDVATIKNLLISCIKEGENTTEYLADNDKAAKLFEEMKRETANLENVTIKESTLKKGVENTELPASIVKEIYPEGKDSPARDSWIFVVNDPTESYVVKTTGVNSEKTECVVSYVTYTDDIFVSVWNTFEAELSLYLLESKVTAPSYNNEEMNTEVFEKAVIQWLMDENFKELVLTKEANKVYDELKTAMADSNSNVLTEKLNSIFGEDGVKEYEDYYSTKKNLDPAVYDYIFNTEKKNTASVVVGKNDRVFLVYVAPTTGSEHEGHDHPINTTVVAAAIKEFEFDAENEEMKSLMTSISEALAKDGRKAPADFAKSADDIAKAALEGFKKTEGATPWEGFTSISVTKKDTGKDYQAIISKIYPNGSSATSVTLKTGEFYQADNNGTSYVFKITEINTTSLDCKVEYVTYEDEENYSYFRSIQSKLNSSISEDAQKLEYPSSITSGSYQAWLFESEYKAAEGENKSSRPFDRKANDITFIATTNTKNEVTGLTIYMVKSAPVQDNDTAKTIYAAYQQFETEKEAQKALNKLSGKTGFELLDLFTSFKHIDRVERDEYTSGGHYPGYVEITSPTIGVDLDESGVSDKNLKEWLFGERNAYDTKIIPSEDGKSYYLAVFASTEEAWSRSARSGWVDEAFTEHLKTLVEGYTINESAMEKIDGVITTTTAATK